MDYPPDQIEALKRYSTQLKALTEGGVTYFLMEGLRLPPGCTPAECDGLLCPVPRDGYTSRLYFSERIGAPYGRNWNGTARIGERNWFAFSWNDGLTQPTLAQLVAAHLAALTREK